MEKALYLNGVFESVLEEIMKAQEEHLGKTFYLQPHSDAAIAQLEKNPPGPDAPLPVYISISEKSRIDKICYSAEIIGWEDKRGLPPARKDLLDQHIKEFQPKEREIYPTAKGKTCVNLISIRNLRRWSGSLSTSKLIKQSDGKPLQRKPWSGFSYVYAPQSLSDEDFAEAVSISLQYNMEELEKRLANALTKPKKRQTTSFGFDRNPDVVAYALKRANGKCELCGSDAPFIRASNGTLYLEVHHWIPLTENGKDKAENAAALCPNCHKEAHFGQNRDFIKSKALAAGAKKQRG